MSVHHVYAVPQGPEEDVSEVTEGCEAQHRCWESNLGPVEEQPVLLTISSVISGVLNHLGRPLSLSTTLFFQKKSEPAT